MAPNLARASERTLRVELLPLVFVSASLVLAGCGLAFGGGLKQALLVGAASLAALVPLAFAAARGRVDPLELGVAVGLAYLVLFPLRAAVVLLDLDPLRNPRVVGASDHVIGEVLVAITLGLLAGGLGYIAPLGGRLGARVRVPPVAAVERPSRTVAVGLFLVGTATEALILRSATSNDVPLIEGRGSGLVSSASVLMLVGLCLLARRAVHSRTRADVVWLAAATLAGIGLGLAGQFKEVAILSLATPLVMWSFTARSPVRLRWVALAVLLVVFVLFPVVTVWRHTSTRAHTSNPVTIVPELPGNFLHYDLPVGAKRKLQPLDVLTEPLAVVSHRLYGFDSLTLAVRYTPSRIPYRHGGTLENLAAGVVPRILWPGKPKIGIGYWFAVHYWGTPPGIPQVPQAVTPPGELWIDFGLPGVIVGMGLLGLWYRFAYSALRPRDSGTAAVIYTVLLLTVVSVDKDLPLAYVTLLQRMVVVALLLGVMVAIPRLRNHRRP